MNGLARDMRLPVLIGLAALVAWPFVFNTSYDLRVFTLAGIYALLVLGFQFIFGHAGALALTQGTFFGLGAYVTGLLSVKLGWGFALTLPLSILAPLVVALIVAAPVLRLESHYFALATLGIGQVLLLIAISWEPMTGGANGLPGVAGVVLFGTPIPRGFALAGFVWSIVAIGAFAAWQLQRGLLGRAYQVMRENDTAAMSLGIDIWHLRFVAFLLSAMYAGVAGALYVHTIRVISPEVLEFHIMVACLTMAVVGGRTAIAGAILGAFLLVHLPEWFRGLKEYYLIAYGAVLLAMIILAPDGLIGLLRTLRERWFPAAPAAPPLAVPLPTRPISRKAGPLLSVEDVSIAFGGVRALDGVSLSIAAGDIFGLIGPNGSGKTTLVNCITGIYRPTGGRIVHDGSSIERRAPYEIARRGVARTFQNINLVDSMTALDNIAVARFDRERASFASSLMAGRDASLARARGHAMSLLERMDCGHIAMQSAGGLPYGLKRRVEIARALALEPTLLLLDEPAAGLNESEQADLARRLRVLADDGLTLLVIEHNMSFLMPLATRMACLDHGQRIAQGTTAQIRADARVIEAYLGSEAGV